MIAKGLDFENATLVGIINADTGLFLPDFRAGERTFQLITQVAGRAGRGTSPGAVQSKYRLTVVDEAILGDKEVTETDREITKEKTFHELFMEDQTEAFKQGGKGVTTDAAVHYEDWGFMLKDIPVKLNVFHGTKDTMVPFE